MNDTKETTWQRTQVQGLLRHRKSGLYYGRWTVSGKQIWLPFQTHVLSVARARKIEEDAKYERMRGSRRAVDSGECTVGQLMEAYEERTKVADLRPASITARLVGLKKVRKTWPEIARMKPAHVTPSAIMDWATRFKAEGTGFVPPGAKTIIRGNSPTSVNRAIDALRRVMAIAVEEKIIPTNPVTEKPTDGRRLKKRVTAKRIMLPSMAEVERLYAAMANNGARGGWGLEAADFCRFLAFTGCRMGEVPGVTWGCVDWNKRTIHVRGLQSDDGESSLKTETSDRFVPLFTELEALLKTIIERRNRAAKYTETGKPMTQPADPIFRLSECQKTIDAAAKAAEIPRMTHHDFRHLFATRCIESGVDIPTVSRWLGHADGGALAMRTYGHLRQDHSAAQAAKVTFAASAH